MSPAETLSQRALPEVKPVRDFTLCSDPAIDNGAHIIMSPSQNIRLELTYCPLNPAVHLGHIRHPQAGANILFTGTTRADVVEVEEPPDDGSGGAGTGTGTGRRRHNQVTALCYTSYIPLCLLTLRSIATEAVQRYGLHGLSIAHRLGKVGVGEESIVIAVSAGHRHVAWEAAEDVLEDCKRKIEIWKKEIVGGAGRIIN